MADPDLSVVVTLLNEQDSVEELYRRTVSALDGKAFEVILVDDGSTDATPTLVSAASASSATSASTRPCTPGSRAPAGRSS
jgi:glycosyltransferase involved in cell wall biosynthesis